ncbi:DUF2293 domain-containing protein [bacterium]|nr:DUF2293 domain-containing protein [bacterium]
MPENNRIVSPGPSEHSVIAEDGTILEVPTGWDVLPPGDAMLTRRVKAAGPSWTVKTKRGRRTLSLGVWAPSDRIAAIKQQLEVERSTESYQKKLASGRRRREKQQTDYVEDFRAAVVSFLDFDPSYEDLEARLATAVAEHATPVGSGTVARTQRIPIDRRAEAAVIAWLRHQTTAYDNMRIPREKGMRREVRRMLAEQSRRLLDKYRRGDSVSADQCPLAKWFTDRDEK